jgi:hypothetical protein
MEGRQNVWDPWYLMTLDNPSKVEHKFCYMIISYYKDRMLFHLDYQDDGNGHTSVDMCPKTQAHYLPIVGEFSF